MQFNPLPDDDLKGGAMNVFARGEYDASIDVATEELSKSSGAAMIKLGIHVYDGAAKTYVFDYLMAEGAAAWKLGAFCKAVGLMDQYHAGELEARNLAGMSLRVKLDIEPARDGYDAKNKVRSYLGGSGVVAKAAPAPSEDDDQDVPF